MSNESYNILIFPEMFIKTRPSVSMLPVQELVKPQKRTLFLKVKRQ